MSAPSPCTKEDRPGCLTRMLRYPFLPGMMAPLADYLGMGAVKGESIHHGLKAPGFVVVSSLYRHFATTTLYRHFATTLSLSSDILLSSLCFQT
jgi:hypothetical protein